MRAFDQAGQIRDDKGPPEFPALFSCAAVCVHDAEIRLQCCERIVGDFRARGRNDGNQRGLPGIGEAHKARICKKFQFQAKMALFSRKTVLVFARGLMPRFSEILVAAATAPAVRHQDALAR